MSSDDSGRLDADEVLIEARAAGATYEEIGALIDVSARTVRRRMSDPDLAARVSTRRSERMAEITGQLVEASQRALRVLHDGMSEEDIYPRMRAAQMVLNFSLRYRSAGELEERLRVLEQRLDAAEEEGS